VFTKEQVGFEHPAKGPHHCWECRHFRGNRCEIVSGAVAAGDWCKKWSRNMNLTTADRKALPRRDFAIPEKAPKSGSFPIEDRGHARAALSRAAHKGGEVERRVRAAVHRKYPGIGQTVKMSSLLHAH
jgi:hypothetical protein